MEKNNLVGAVACSIFLVLSIMLVIFPVKIQKYFLEYYERNENLRKMKSFLGFMETEGYVIMLRVMGVMCFLVFLLFLVTFIGNLLIR
jgi:purine-nucleoside phosphorylase